MIDTGLAGKVALITGGNHGIGAATARALAREGASVLINYLRMPALGSPAPSDDASSPGLAFYNSRRAQDADEVVRNLREQGGRAQAIEADLSNPTTIPWLFEQAEYLFGPVDVLVNNADYCQADTFIPKGYPGSADLTPGGYPLSALSAESHDRHFAINSRAVALMMAEFARRRITKDLRDGRIINLSTDAASGFGQNTSYGASKFAMESYSRAAAHELGPYGITVNIVSPGPTQTGWITPAMEQALSEQTPLRRVGQPEDLADVIVFLASQQARWLTGQILYVGGGHRML
ncbi:SDR family NAD(P)-dependent oxidoreductase [Dictyobacter aurantiacus]|uniref:3-oxoacyl-ACP reductase n=1 Tax=Dictyobacter aurantiacus TaxID=1936993 RepID=A0A401ZM59_9CHLR|nr:SDR family oxidoreductase [Dictyobacter aurantiacus]GCE07955.1 3-oxoacyl-ACP reductase [Dictyobacter aurantiacus]